MEPKVHRFPKMWLLLEREVLLEGPKSEHVEKPLVLTLFLVRGGFGGEGCGSWLGGVICTVGRIKEGLQRIKERK